MQSSISVIKNSWKDIKNKGKWHGWNLETQHWGKNKHLSANQWSSHWHQVKVLCTRRIHCLKRAHHQTTARRTHLSPWCVHLSLVGTCWHRCTIISGSVFLHCCVVHLLKRYCKCQVHRRTKYSWVQMKIYQLLCITLVSLFIVELTHIP